MLLFLRFLPFLLGILNAALFIAQSRYPSSYPWIVAISPILLAASALLIGWKRHQGAVLVQRSIPSLLAVSAAAFAMLLAEGVFAQVALPVFVGLASFLCLELMFLSVYLPSRYPVNGLSHLNLSLVPVTLWLLAFTSVGLTVFLNMTRILPVAVMTAAVSVMFWSTSHVESAPVEQRRWMMLGAWIGFQVGLLCAVLPFGLMLHGTVAAVTVSLALRSRRYLIAPAIPKKIIVLEGASVALFLILILSTAAWV